MLAIFQKSVSEGPQELVSPRITRTLSVSGRLDAGEILSRFKEAHGTAVILQFDEEHAIAYSQVPKPSGGMQRLFAANDDIFCAFTGMLTNLPQLRQRYGLDKSVGEVTLLMEAYKTLRDRRPYPPDQVVADLAGAFAFVLYDHKNKKVFVAQDPHGKVPLYWGKCLDDGVLAFSDDSAVLKAGTGSSCAPFPLGCFYTDDGGLQSFVHPDKAVKPVPHVNSQGELCGSAFKVDSQPDLQAMNEGNDDSSNDGSNRGWKLAIP